MAIKKTPHPGVTKADLVDVVYDRHGGLTKDEAAEIVDTIFRTVKVSLADGRSGSRTSAPSRSPAGRAGWGSIR